jgi:biopolymer transport protein ExbB
MTPLFAAASFKSVIQFFVHGGVFMVPLLLCSLVSVAVIIIRGLALRRELVLPPVIEEEIENLQPEDEDGVAKIGRLVGNDESTLARIAQVGLQNLNWPRGENFDAVQTKAKHEIVRLETGLFILEIIVGIAPLLGLLGAVSGLVKVFAAFGGDASAHDPKIMATGISEALSTTIVGLAVAIPSLIAYSYYSKKVETMAAVMETLIGELLAKAYYQKHRRLTARIMPPPEDDERYAAALEEEEEEETL